MPRCVGHQAVSPYRPGVVLPALVLLLACGSGEPPEASAPGETDARALDTARVPLNELLDGATYLGFTGGLYPRGSNTMPSEHFTAGGARAAAIQPLDTAGNPSPHGKYVLLSIGMSNTTQEFCSHSGAEPCDFWTFMGKAAADPAVNKSTLVIANGARGGQAAPSWDSPTDSNYDRVRDTVLAPQGLSEQQVQILWIKQANAGPSVSLPETSADAYRLKASLGAILRAAKVRYPNLQQAFISSRIYAGYATTLLNPEPYAYESGFAVKWVIEAQIRQLRNGTIDTQAGNLDYTSGLVPWVAWGPYLWANGTTPRSDGLFWEPSNFEADGTHPSQSGENKVATLLMNFFKNSPHTRCWFLGGPSC
jgi:hypothetical protein